MIREPKVKVAEAMVAEHAATIERLQASEKALRDQLYTMRDQRDAARRELVEAHERITADERNLECVGEINEDLTRKLAEARRHIEWQNDWLVKNHGTCDPDALRAWSQIRTSIDPARKVK